MVAHVEDKLYKPHLEPRTWVIPTSVHGRESLIVEQVLTSTNNAHSHERLRRVLHQEHNIGSYLTWVGHLLSISDSMSRLYGPLQLRLYSTAHGDDSENERAEVDRQHSDLRPLSIVLEWAAPPAICFAGRRRMRSVPL